jgi:hypothetical protein
MTSNGGRLVPPNPPKRGDPLPTKLLLWVIVICVAALLLAGTIAAIRALL